MSSSEVVGEEEAVLNLPKQFDLIYEFHQYLEKTDEPTSSDNVQGQLRKEIQRTESAIEMVNELDLFSRNEDIEEVSTNEIRYMMLSAFLAYFVQHNTHMPRTEAVKKSKMCYKDFLSLSNSYNVTDIKITGTTDDDDEQQESSTVSRALRQDVNAMAVQRSNKIQRFKEKKALETKMAELKVLVDRDSVDDEVKRQFYLTQVKHWANVAVDEISNCDMELQMLAHREALKEQNSSESALAQKTNNKSKVQPFRPFILTKTKMQQQVFGAGYPALPSMTVDEFYEQKLKEGTLSESVQGGHSMQQWAADPEADTRQQEKEAEEKEEKIESDDPEMLMRARAMDDWKDEHRRGDGNRYNKG